MDVVMAERVNKLARSLKDLHLAATMDEAFKRAEEILGGRTEEKNEEKTLNELMGAPQKKQQETPPESSAPVEEIIIRPSQEPINDPKDEPPQQTPV